MRTTARASKQSGTYLAYVKEQYRKSHTIPALPYQTGGILSKPIWNSKSSIVRIVPGFDKETGEIFRQNINCNEFSTDASYTEYLSDTFMMTSTVQDFGERRQKFVTSYAPGSKDEEEFGGDTVINRFIKNVMYSVNAKKTPKFVVSTDMRRWAAKDGILRYDRTSLLVQALVFTVNDRVNTQNDMPLVDEEGNTLPLLAVISIEGKSSINNLLTALIDPANPALPLDACTNNKYGGMAEADGNLLYLNAVRNAEANAWELKPSVQAPGKGWTPTPFPLNAQTIQGLWTPWEDLLHYMTAEEQCLLLASEFGAEAVNYLVGTDMVYRHFNIPEQIAAKGYGQYAQFVDGTTSVGSSYSPSDNSSIIKPKPLGALKPVMEAAAVTYTPKAASQGLPKAPTAGIKLPTSNAVDVAKVEAAMQQIKAGAAGIAPQEADVDDLINDPELQEYMQDNE